MNILVYDSGVGSIPVLSMMAERLSDVSFFLLSDSRNMPYGDKDTDFLRQTAFHYIDILNKAAPIDCAVIACNTLTAAAVDFLRTIFPFPIIGTEPAILPAAKAFPNEKIYVLSTELTASAERISKRFSDYKERLVFVPMPRLASLIENGADACAVEHYLLDKLMLPQAYPFPLVLGCTHYSLVREVIERLFPLAVIFDGAEGAARKACSVINQITRKSKGPTDCFYKNPVCDNKIYPKRPADNNTYQNQMPSTNNTDNKSDCHKSILNCLKNYFSVTPVTSFLPDNTLFFLDTEQSLQKSQKMSEFFIQYSCKNCVFLV